MENNIKALRVPIDENPLKFTVNILSNLDGKRVCAVIPTARNLRILANINFTTVELFAAKDFTSFANLASGIHVPKQLRPFYLRKAAFAVSKKDKIALFKTDGGIFFENFGAFSQVSLNIFSFYRELSSEMINMNDLSAAGKYTDYEEQIKALGCLWQTYLKLLAKDGLTDEWEDFKAPKFRKNFIDRYDEFVFLIGGYLTKYELKQLEQVGKFKNVTLIFNYAGAKYSLHEQYEKYLSIELDNRPLKAFPPSTCHIVACSSMAAQIELITKEAFRFEQNGIPFNKMAILIPDERVKTYFLRLDPYNLFDVTSNENIDALPAYSATKKIMEAACQVIKSKSSQIEINSLISLFNAPCIKDICSMEETVPYLNKLLNNGKLYLSLTDIQKSPAFKNFPIDFLNVAPFMSTSKAALLFKNIFIYFSGAGFPYGAEKVLAKLDELEIIYAIINDEIEFEENFNILISEVSKLRIETPKGKISVMGILESRNLHYDLLFIPAMNEEYFPPSNKKDLFLNTEIRKELGLPTFQDRESLMQNYLLQIMEKAKYCLISYESGTNAKRRSKFVEELAVKNSLIPQIFSPKSLSLLQSEQRFFPTNKELVIEKNEQIINSLSLLTFSATAFNDYISCPLSFYFKRIDSNYPSPEGEEEIAAKHIGSAFHKAFEALYRKNITPSSKSYSDELIKIYREELSTFDAYKTDPVERFKASIAENGVPLIAKSEEKRILDGYLTVNREKQIKTSFFGKKIQGKIDRVDIKDNKYYIIDYKFKEVSSPTKTYDLAKQSDLQMPFYALLLENSQNIIPEELLYFDLKNQFNFITAFNMTQYSEFKEFAEMKFEEMFSSEHPFIKTKQEDRCRYCNYATICDRVTK